MIFNCPHCGESFVLENRETRMLEKLVKSARETRIRIRDITRGKADNNGCGYTSDDVNYILSNNQTKTAFEIALKLGRTRDAIRTFCWKQGISLDFDFKHNDFHGYTQRYK